MSLILYPNETEGALVTPAPKHREAYFMVVPLYIVYSYVQTV